ncbi:Uncharacterised protein at_DN1719, partial [Pycnogonum litorale]
GFNRNLHLSFVGLMLSLPFVVCGGIENNKRQFEATETLIGSIVAVIGFVIIVLPVFFLISNAFLFIIWPIFDANGLGFPNLSSSVKILSGRKRRRKRNLPESEIDPRNGYVDMIEQLERILEDFTRRFGISEMLQKFTD